MRMSYGGSRYRLIAPFNGIAFVFLLLGALYLLPGNASLQSASDPPATPAAIEPDQQTSAPLATRPEILWMRSGHTAQAAMDHAWNGDTMATMDYVSVKFWRTSDGALLRTIPRIAAQGPPTPSISIHLLTINSNGKVVAFNSSDKQVVVYNVETRELMATFNFDGAETLDDIDLTPEGLYLAASMHGGTTGVSKLQVLRIADSATIAEKLNGEAGYDIEYSWHNQEEAGIIYRLAATVPNTQNVRIYDARAPGYPLMAQVNNLGSTQITFNHDSDWLVAYSHLGVRAVNSAGGMPITLVSNTAFQGTPVRLRFARNDQHLVITGRTIDGNANAGNVSTMRVPNLNEQWMPNTFVTEFNVETLGISPLHVTMSNTSKLAAWGNNYIRFWDTSTRQISTEYENPFFDMLSPVKSVAFSLDGTMVAAATEGAGGMQNVVPVWNTFTRARINRINYGPTSATIDSVGFTPDNENVIVSGSAGIHMLKVSGTPGPTPMPTPRPAPPPGSGDRENFVTSPDRRTLAVEANCGAGPGLQMINASTLGNGLSICLNIGVSTKGKPLAFDYAGDRIAGYAYGFGGAPVKIHATSNGSSIYSLHGGIEGVEGRGSFSPDGRYFFSATQSSLKAWRLIGEPGTDLQPVVEIPLGNATLVEAIQVTADSGFVYVSTRDRRIRVWKISDPNPNNWTLVKTYDEETSDGVSPMVLSPDTSRLFYGRRDATVVMANNVYGPTSIQFSTPAYFVNENGVTATITATRTGGSADAVGISYATSDGTATAGVDYSSSSGTLSWADGELGNKTITIQINSDNIDEPDETVNLTLSNVTGRATLGSPGTAVLTITDDDGLPGISINDVTIPEPLGGTITADFTVGLSNPSSQAVTVQYATANGTAAAPGDYVSIPTTTLTFNPLETTKTVSVTVNNDAVAEAMETYFINLSNPSVGASIIDNQGLGSIQQLYSNGKIAFASNRDGDLDIFSMDANGSGITNLTANTFGDVWPGWSPDGGNLVFASNRDGNYEIYKMTQTGASPQRLTTDGSEDSLASWSTDGTKIAFMSKRDGNDEVYVMNSSGALQTRLTTNSAVDDVPEWSPGGDKIVFGSSRDGNWEIYVMDANGANQTRLTNNSAFDTYPAWSPDGTRIVFHSNRDGNGEIYSMRADGTEQTRLTNDAADDSEPKWSPDGTKIIFQSNRHGNPEIYIMNADGSSQTRVTNDPASDVHPAWQPVMLTQSIISLTADSYSINEATGAATITVKRFGVGLPTTVNYQTTAGTATPGSDYSETSGILTFSGTESTKTITIPVFNDAAVEPTETLTITLSSPTGGVFGIPVAATVNIADNDPAGSLDLSFDGDGKVITDLSPGSTHERAYGMALQMDGKIILVGNNNGGVGLARYNANGTLDFSFNGNGKVRTELTGGSARDIAIQADGKIVVVGFANVAGSSKMILLRYHPSGILDTTFDGDGIVINDFGFSTVYGSSLAIQADGKIVAVGHNNVGGNDNLVVSRFFPSGFLDTSFSIDGWTTFPSFTVDADLSGKVVAIQSNNKIVVSGVISSSQYVMGTVRYNPNGELDNSFDNDGVVTTPLGTSAWALCTTIQADGKILVGGFVEGGPANGNFAMVRYEDNGVLDNSFDMDGVVTTDMGSRFDYITGIALQADGKIIAAGSTFHPTTPLPLDFALARYRSNGSLDESFDTDGKVITDVSGAFDDAQGLAIQADGQIVIGGSVLNSPSPTAKFALARYNSGSSSSTLQFSSPTYSVNENGTTATITVTRTGSSAGAVTVGYATSNGTAMAGTDYVAATGTLNWADGDQAAKTFTVSISDDSVFEGDETVNIALSNPTGNAVIGSPSAAVLTIADNETQPTISIANTTTGGEPSTGNVFTVTLSSQTTSAVTVHFVTANGTAIAGSDYTATSGDITFAAGTTTLMQTVAVSTLDDIVFEGSENFTVALSAATNATISGTNPASGTVADNETQPTVSIARTTAGAEPATANVFTVTLSGQTTAAVSVNYATANGTATAGSDYTSASNTLTFAANTTTLTQTISVSTLDDLVFEGSENFNVTLSAPTNATISGTNPAIGTIADNETRPTLSINNVTQNEGNSGTTPFTFTVGLSGPTTQTVTVNYATANGTATAPSDYNALPSIQLTFSPGDLTKTVTVLVNGDTGIEPNETFFVNLSGAVNSTISIGQGIGTINNDDSTVQRTPFDYDGDGKADLSVFRPSNGIWYIERSQAGFFGINFGNSTDRIVPADYDGDGKTDVAVYRPSEGIWYIVNSSNGANLSFRFGLNGDLPAPADYDGDGKADLCVFRPSDGTWYRQNSGNGTFFAIQFGANGDKPTIGDFDGDGKADIALYRPSNGAWYQIRSANGAIFAEQFGFATDVIVPADYDGDGKTDLAVYRPEGGVWFIKRSATTTYTAYPFGISTDIPAAGDFDGDGKADLSIFRPSEGNWYRQNSSNGSFNTFPFGVNGDRPTQSAFQ